MWSRSELKTNAKAALKRYFWKALVAFIIVGAIALVVSWVIGIIVGLVTGVSVSELETLENINNGSLDAYTTTELPEGYAAAMSISYLLILAVSIFFIEPIAVGLIRFFQKSRGLNTGFGEIFVPLKKFAHVGLVVFWMGIKVFLWSLLLVVPGIIKAYEYSMVPYLLAENPDISGKRAFQISKAMTNGNKWNLFVLDLSFILWYLLGSITCGIAYIWVIPYVEATSVEAYYKLKAGAVANGSMTLQEVPDICLPVQPPFVPFEQAAAMNNANVAAAPVAVPNSAVTATAAAAAVAAESTPAAPTAEPAVEASDAAVEETPAEAAVEAPVEAVEETPAEAAVEAPAEAVEETPAEAAVEAPAEAVEETPAEAAVEAPAETVEETPAEAVEKVPDAE